MTAQAALEKAAKLVDGRYNPRGNVHTPWWISKTVSNSKLTQMKAVDLARIMFDEKSGTYTDSSPKFWSYKGNSLADAALADFRHREVVATWPTGFEDYYLSAAADGVMEIDGFVLVAEHKAFGEPNWDKMDQALRQGANHLAMMWRNVQNGVQFEFDLAPWASRIDNTPFLWKTSYRPAGVLRAVAPNAPPHIITPLVLSDSELDQILDFYLAKGRAVLKAATTGDFSEAEQWDRDHVTEFTRRIDTITEPPKELEGLLPKYEAAKKTLKEAEAEKERLHAEVILSLDTAGLQTATVGGIEVKLTEKKGRRYADVERLLADGLDQYVKEGKSYAELRTRDLRGD